MFPAENGDAFLLCSTNINILIDGGYAKTFDKYIKPDLEDLASKGKVLDLVIVTHIDADHIGGIIRFLTLNGIQNLKKIIPINKIWHNSLRSLSSPKKIDVPPEGIDILKAIIKRGHPKESIFKSSNIEEISAKQGCTLAALIREGGYRWNESNGFDSICVEEFSFSETYNDSIKVINPTRAKLQELLLYWKKELRRFGHLDDIGSNEIIDDAFEFNFEHHQDSNITGQTLVAAGCKNELKDVYRPDRSPTNASSIATIVKLDGVRILMLADALAEDILNELIKMQADGESMLFDAIKISHHGSNYNTSPDLLSIIDAPKYFISTNGGGKHNHPDIELLRAIVNRAADFTRTLYFNYSTDASKEIRNFQATYSNFIIEENFTGWIEIIKEKSC